MEYKVVVPTLGESVVEGTVIKWLKNEGDAVKIDDTLVEIMTDKVVTVEWQVIAISAFLEETTNRTLSFRSTPSRYYRFRSWLLQILRYRKNLFFSKELKEMLLSFYVDTSIFFFSCCRFQFWKLAVPIFL